MKGSVTSPIPAELQSVALDGVVAAAEAIYDYTKSKTLELLNETFNNGIRTKISNNLNVNYSETTDNGDTIKTFTFS